MAAKSEDIKGWRDWTKRKKALDMDNSVVITGGGGYKGTK